MRQLAYRGSRLVSRAACRPGGSGLLLIILFNASVSALIPLYAIGVFLSFTLSQAGMARRWWKIGHLAPGQEVRERGSTLRYEPGWQAKMVINGLKRCSAVVTLVFTATKFGGAPGGDILRPLWWGILRRHRHYRGLESLFRGLWAPPMGQRSGHSADQGCAGELRAALRPFAPMT
jgi:hypothetical protein